MPQDTQSSAEGGGGTEGLTYLFKLIKTQFELTQFFTPNLMLPFFTADLKTFDFIDVNTDKKLQVPESRFVLLWVTPQLLSWLTKLTCPYFNTQKFKFILMQFRHFIKVAIEWFHLFS